MVSPTTLSFVHVHSSNSTFRKVGLDARLELDHVAKENAVAVFVITEETGY